MKQHYFVVVLAHSLHGRIRRIQISHRVVYAVLALALVGCFSVFGFVSSYARMAWKVANYNSLRQEITALRARYASLQKVTNQQNDQLAQLQLFASEISMAYGLKQKLEGPADIASEGKLIPTLQETLEEYDLLRTANLSSYSYRYLRRRQGSLVPGGWPVDGRLEGFFGNRTDPFSGEGAFHWGVDIVAPYGTPVRAAGDGIVLFARFMNGFGRLVVVDHGNGYQTYYAHLSRFAVVPGQEIREGETLGALGASGRVTAAHLHYEVRRMGTAVNPAAFLGRHRTTPVARTDFPF
jgi:murein DD-endopeptidase MepM/ murein hydrolase activator NlpD